MSGAVPRGLVVYRALPCLLPRVAHVVDRYCSLGTVGVVVNVDADCVNRDSLTRQAILWNGGQNNKVLK